MPHRAVALGPPTAVKLQSSNCSTATLAWRPPDSAAARDVLEYEMVVHPLPSGQTTVASPFAISGVHEATHTIANLESSTDYTAQVRARGPDGWGALADEIVFRTGPPPRVLPSPHAPVQDLLLDNSHDRNCATMQLRLPSLRRGCTLESALSLEYREAGGDVWRAYELASNAITEGVRVTLPQEHSSGSVEFRLLAHRGPLTSEPSAVLGPLETCTPPPARSLQTVVIALVVAAVVCVIAALAICRASTRESFSPAGAPRKEPGMTRLKMTDDDELEGGLDRDELSVHYHLADAAPTKGMLPLGGISQVSELLEEVAEFGNELQDDMLINRSLMEVSYEDRRGKVKIVGPRSQLGEIIESGELTVVVSKLRHLPAAPRAAPPRRVANGPQYD